MAVITNLYSGDPSFENGVGRFVNFNAWTFGVTTDQAKFGSQSIHFVRGTGDFGPVDNAIESSLTSGAGLYTFTAWVYVPSSVPLTAVVGPRIHGPGVANPMTLNVSVRDTWTEVEHTFSWNGTGNVDLYATGTIGSEFYLDGISLYAGSVLYDTFDGDTPDDVLAPGESGYEYAWVGTPRQSASTRTDVTEPPLPPPPPPPPPIPFCCDANSLGDTAAALLDCAVTALEACGRPVCEAFLAPGSEVVWTCCDCPDTPGGQLWVATSVQSGFYAAGRAGQSDCLEGFQVSMRVGLVRCVSGLNNQGGGPTPEDMTQDALDMYADAAILQDALTGCLLPHVAPKSQRLGQGRPLGPQGNCAGWEWSLDFKSLRCC